MVKMFKNYCCQLKVEELEKSNIYDKKENKCKECNVLFTNDDERSDHYLQQHLVYFPSSFFKSKNNDDNNDE